MSSPQQLPDNFRNIVRLFPLGDLVAFPSNVLPLHIFESRYREMFEDAIAGDQLIAMATLIPGHKDDYYTRPPVHPTICIGRIMGHETTAQGTYEFLLLGICRARIETEVEPIRSFREARVTLLEDTLDASAGEQQDLMNSLTSVLKDRFPTADQLLDVIDSGHFELPALTDFLAFQLPLSTSEKLELLNESSVTRRALKLLQHCDRDRRRPARPTGGGHGRSGFPDFSNN